MELNVEQIKKALECCASEEYICTQCPIDEKIKDDCECGKVVARNALALITSQEQRIGAYRQELAEVRVALAEANKERQELTEELISVRNRADETIDALHSEVRELTEELEKRPPRLIITRREPK